MGVAPAGVFGLHSIEVSTGALIYLVSACGSGEEFVAAFRRYADRNGLFVPIADPIAAGRRGRFAVALADGGVMIEGEAEVVSSARTPSVLHGRVGMTLRFVSPDEPSRTVLVELEKARLAMKPPPPSVPPRPAAIPPAPRPVPPAPAGRIDATNALAECVAIGDVGALEVIAKDPVPRKTGQKFVVPTIPPIAPKAPTPAASTVYDSNVELPTISAAAPAPAPARPAADPDDAWSLDDAEGTPAAAVPPGPPTELAIEVPPVPPGPPTELAIPVPPLPRAGSEADPPPPAPGGLVPAPPIVAARPTPDDALGSVEVNDEPTDLSAVPLEPVEPPGATAEPVTEPAEPLTEPAELLTEPALEALPPAEPPCPPAEPPRPPAEPPRPPVIGIPPSTPVRPPNIEEPTPSGDWTMIPGADGPTIEPRTPKPRSEGTPAGDWSISLATPPKDEPRTGPAAAVAAAPPAPAPPARPSPMPRRAKSDPMPVVASTRPLESDPQRPVADVAGFSEPKVQVDPTLIEPLKPMPPEAAPPAMRPSGSQPTLEAPMAASSSSGMRLQNLLTPVPGFMPPYAAPPNAPPIAPPPVPPMPPFAAPVMDPGQSGVPMLPIEGGARAEATVRVRFPSGDVAPARPSRRTQVIVVAVSAALVLAAAAVLLLIPRGDEAPSGPPAPTRPAVAPRAPADADAAPAQAPDAEAVAAAEVAAPPDERAADGSAAGSAADSTAPPAGAGGCSFDVTSTPTRAEILLDKGVIGTTPTKLTLPCDVEHRLAFRKQRYLTTERKYTPTEAGKPLRVNLARPTYLVKVSSTPPGATVLVGGRSLGVTPTTIRIPINETSTLTFKKEGFTSVTQKVTPKQNNQSVSASLKRAPRRAPR